MEKSSSFLVKLTPAGRFVFGDSPQGEYGNRNNYFIRSNYFPQQSGVLGFVRHQLLLMNGLLIEGEKGIRKENREAANALIGDHGFDEKQIKYGVIEYVSPLFIMNDNNFFFERSWELCAGSPVFFDGQTLKNYDAKKGFENILVSNSGCFKQKNEEVFIKQEQSGIRRENKIVTENAYYRQMSYKLNKGFCFAFFVRLQNESNNKPVEFTSSLVYFGKERSIYKMEICRQSPSLGFTDEVYQSQAGSGKFLCISDVKISNAELKKIIVNGEVVPFRYQMTNTNTQNHYNYKDQSKYNLQLLKRGSILYMDNELAVKIQTENEPFYNIGYNHLVAVKHTLTH